MLPLLKRRMLILLNQIKTEFNAILTIAFRDITKLLRDRVRLISGLVFPVIFIGVLGGSLQANVGSQLGFNFLVFVFTGVFIQSLFQSTASGVIFLLEDRNSDFSQELFVAPVSPRSIIFGKILGESMVALTNAFGILVFGLLVGVSFTFWQAISLIAMAIAGCLLGGAFGIIVLSNLSEDRTVRQIFPFLIFPQIFLAGVFAPLKEVPTVLFILSKIIPLTYVVDFGRGLYYWGTDTYDQVVLLHPLVNLAVILAMFLVFLFVGTWLFVRKERDR